MLEVLAGGALWLGFLWVVKLREERPGNWRRYL